MDSRKKLQSTLEKQERLRLKRKEWHTQQEYERRHEERKLQMIAEYERKRAEAIKKENYLYGERQSKSPQRRKTSSTDYEHSKEQKASMIANGPEDIIIDKNELHKVKISIYKESNLPTKDQSTSNKIERDIVNPDDIILPRRQNEGACPMFQRNEIKGTEEIRKIILIQDEQLVSEKQLSTNRKNVHIHRRSDDNIIQHRAYNSTVCRDDQTDDDRYNHDRRRRDSKEKNRDRSERRDRSISRYSSRSSPLNSNHSRSCYRSQSPIKEQTKERKVDDDKNKFSSKGSRGGYSDQSRKLDNSVSRKPNYPFSHNSYILPRPMSIPRIQTPSTPLYPFVPVFPGLFTAPFPFRWPRPPPRFINSRGTGIHTNRY